MPKRTRSILWFLPFALCILVSCRGEQAALPVIPALVGTEVPEFPEDLTWFNTDEPIRIAGLRDRVTLIYFWTGSSINSLRALNQTNYWHSHYNDFGLTVIGVHAPQFSFETGPEMVKQATIKNGILHPVVVDGALETWSRFRNRAWPTFYLVDHLGVIRRVVVGEDEFESLNADIQDLLAEAGYALPGFWDVPVSDVDFSKLGTPEIHVGYEDISHFGSPEPLLADQVQTYGARTPIERSHFYLVGDWEIQKERGILRGRGGKIVIRFEASRAYFMFNSVHGARLRGEVRLDGEPLTTENYGRDVWFRDGKSFIEVDQARVYEAFDGRGEYGEHVLEISFPERDVEIYSIMFG